MTAREITNDALAIGHALRSTSRATEPLRDAAERIVADALVVEDYHIARAAARLGVSRSTLERWIAVLE